MTPNPWPRLWSHDLTVAGRLYRAPWPPERILCERRDGRLWADVPGDVRAVVLRAAVDLGDGAG